MCGQVRGQRFADRNLEGIDLVGEVTELRPCQGQWAWVVVSALDSAEPIPERATWD